MTKTNDFTFIGIFLTLLTFIGCHFLLFSPLPAGTVAGKSTSALIENSLSIGEFHFNLFGYTSPQAQVTIEGMGIYDQTYARNDGYFQFKNRFSPFSPREACLSSKDQLGRLTSAVCLPAFPTDYNITIGPVVMPPTVSLDKNDYFVGDEVILSGQTIPKTEVDLLTFTKGYRLPQLTASSDDHGNFSILLPASAKQTFRLFTRANYQNSPSPKSISLQFKILPVWMIIIKFFILIWLTIKSRLLEILILAEIIGLIIYFVRRYFYPHAISRERALALREKYPLTH